MLELKEKIRNIKREGRELSRMRIGSSVLSGYRGRSETVLSSHHEHVNEIVTNLHSLIKKHTERNILPKHFAIGALMTKNTVSRTVKSKQNVGGVELIGALPDGSGELDIHDTVMKSMQKSLYDAYQKRDINGDFDYSKFFTRWNELMYNTIKSTLNDIGKMIGVPYEITLEHVLCVPHAVDEFVKLASININLTILDKTLTRKSTTVYHAATSIEDLKVEHATSMMWFRMAGGLFRRYKYKMKGGGGDGAYNSRMSAYNTGSYITNPTMRMLAKLEGGI